MLLFFGIGKITGPKVRMLPLNRMNLGGAACVHYLEGKKSINRYGKCYSGLARQEISKITSWAVLPVQDFVGYL